MRNNKDTHNWIEINLAVYDEQDRLFRALFRALPAGRRERIAMRELCLAAEANGISGKAILRELRDEMKLIATVRAQKEQKEAADATT